MARPFCVKNAQRFPTQFWRYYRDPLTIWARFSTPLIRRSFSGLQLSPPGDTARSFSDKRSYYAFFFEMPSCFEKCLLGRSQAVGDIVILKLWRVPLNYGAHCLDLVLT